jgi:hypothetical protein
MISLMCSRSHRIVMNLALAIPPSPRTQEYVPVQSSPDGRMGPKRGEQDARL